MTRRGLLPDLLKLLPNDTRFARTDDVGGEYVGTAEFLGSFEGTWEDYPMILRLAMDGTGRISEAGAKRNDMREGDEIATFKQPERLVCDDPRSDQGERLYCDK